MNPLRRRLSEMDNETDDLVQKDLSENTCSLKVKIKQEKIDAEIEEKVKSAAARVKQEPADEIENNNVSNKSGSPEHVWHDESNSNSNESSNSEEEEEERETEVDDKKAIQPVKSSNEILEELFKVFNAAPPEELLDDKNLLKKSHKRKKSKKEKKKKRKKDKSDGHVSNSDKTDSLDGNKHKHKRKKKHKHKTDKVRSKVKVKVENSNRSKEREQHANKHEAKEKDRGEQKRKEGTKSRESRRHSRGRSKERNRERKKDCDQYDSERIENRNQRITISSNLIISVKEEPEERLRGEKSRKRHVVDPVSTAAVNAKRRRTSSSDYNYKIEVEPKPSYRKSTRHKEDASVDAADSEISLSDEETYLKEKERPIKDTERQRYDNGKCHLGSVRKYSPLSSSRNRRTAVRTDRYSNNFYSGSRYHRRSRSRSRVRSHSRSRTHSRSRSRSLGINKKRLLEIARKNAISMFKRGNLPGCADMSQEIKDKVLLKMRYGGRTVQDLTDFCKKISNGENLSDLSSDEDSDVDKGGNAKAFHHPFQVKEREPIVMHIRNATPIQPRRTDDQAKAITMQFPVSSGQQHRLTEVWVPVDTKESLPSLPALPAATQSTSIFKTSNVGKNVQKNVFEKPMPQQERQEPAFKPVADPTAIVPAKTQIPTITVMTSSAPASLPGFVPAPAPASLPAAPTELHTEPHSTVACNLPEIPVTQQPFAPDTAVPSTSCDSIFPQTSAALDVSSIISKRLNAMRRLQENPMDSEAIKMMYNSQRDMSSWVSSKHLPGQFTGSTGVNILKVHELNSGPQVWARRDQLIATKPVTGGMGMQLLQKMGWKPGEGLGREKTGSLQPLLLDVKLDKRGLVAKDDHNHYQRRAMPVKKQRANNTVQVQQDLQSKHPVCLLNELTSKRKWTPPLYSLVNEMGPSHNKMFMFSVSINGQIYTPNQASNTKKEAKLIAARYCLQQIGVLP